MATVKMDLGVGDVHTDGPVKVKKMGEINAKKRNALPGSAFALPKTRQYPIHDKAHAENAMARLEQNKARLTPAEYASAKSRIQAAERRFGVKAAQKPRAGGGKGLSMHIDTNTGTVRVRHMADGEDSVLFGGLTSLDATALSDTEKRVWIQLAKSGEFRGHSAGPFALNDKVFAEIVTNFKTRGQPIPIDMEHSSESDPTSGSIPTLGAPAQGWIHDMRIQSGELWGLVEWGDLARQYIKDGKYRYFSPAIRFNSKSPETGAPVGARMTSGALTNQPFLAQMQRLAASDRILAIQSGQEVPVVAMGAYSYSSHEYMPAFKRALGMHELTSATECMDRLCTLEEMHGAGGGADVHGVPVSSYTMALRDAMRMSMNTTTEEIFDAVKAMIAAAIEEHEAEYHEEAPESGELSDVDENNNITPMTENNQMDATKLLTDVTQKNAELTLKCSDQESEIATLRGKLQALEDWKKGQEAKTLSDRVDEAYDTYKDARQLTDNSKSLMLLSCEHARETFEKEYPRVKVGERHLLRKVVPMRDNGRSTIAGEQPMNLLALTAKIQKDNGLAYDEALILADKQLRAG